MKNDKKSVFFLSLFIHLILFLNTNKEIQTLILDMITWLYDSTITGGHCVCPGHYSFLIGQLKFILPSHCIGWKWFYITSTGHGVPASSKSEGETPYDLWWHGSYCQDIGHEKHHPVAASNDIMVSKSWKKCYWSENWWLPFSWSTGGNCQQFSKRLWFYWAVWVGKKCSGSMINDGVNTYI